MLDIETVLGINGSELLRCSNAGVKSAPTPDLKAHVNICLTFAVGRELTLLEKVQDTLAFASHLVTLIYDKQAHVCDCDKAVETELQQYIL